MAEETTFGSIASVLLILAAVVVLLLFITRQLHAGDLSVDEQKCRDSIALHSHVVHLGGGGSTPPIECTPKVVTVDNRDPDKAKQQVADQMVFCWDRWQQGKAELFTEDGIYCNPCSIIRFTDPSKPIRGFSTYLTTQKTKYDLTYAQYLLGFQTEAAKGNVKYDLPDASVDRIAADQDFSVVFVYAKGKSVQTIKDNFAKNPVGSTKQIALMTGVGAVAGVAALAISTGGIGLVVIGVGAVAGGGMAALGEYFFGSAPRPEWVSFVVLQPYAADSFTGLNCSKINQAGVPQQVGGAENI